MKKIKLFKVDADAGIKERLFPLLFAFAIFFLSGTANASAIESASNDPTYPEIIVPWLRLEESADMIDVSYTIVRCQSGEDAKIMLQVFNEGGQVSALNFTLSIKDNLTGVTVLHQVSSFAIPFASIYTAECGSGNHPDLSIEVPLGFDPTNLTIDISYN